MQSVVFLLVLLAGVGFIVYQLIQFFLAINNGRSRLEQEAMDIRAYLIKNAKELIPFEPKEFELLSGKFEENKVLSTGLVSGTLFTIYAEPIAHFGKVVLSGSNYAVLVVQTEKHQYTYLDYVHETQVLVDGRQYGSINSKDELLDSSKNVIADLKDGYTGSHIPLYIKDLKAATVIAPGIATSGNDRAFDRFEIDSEDDLQILTIMSFYMMLT